ncbi:MAG TPA: hypothetical protein VFT22_06520 [Kofleriaceae bacterium]|nr:hypothetical protein [Kofleriaceae bacterium]
MDIEALLRKPAHRKGLVLAAEGAVIDARGQLPKKTQLNRLVSICGEATCAEEITSYLLYQSSRERWPSSFAKIVIAKLEVPLQELLGPLSGAQEDERDRLRVATWRLYAVFLVRASTYATEARNGKKGNDHDHPGR